MQSKRNRIYQLSILSVIIISLAYIISGITTYTHLQRLNRLQRVLHSVKLYDCSISAQAELLRTGVYNSREHQLEWQSDLEEYNRAMNELFTLTVATSPSEEILRAIPEIQELWKVSYERIRAANSFLEYFRYLPAGEALSVSIREKKDSHTRSELYKLSQLNYELETYDNFLKDVLSEKLNSISNEIEEHIQKRKLKLTVQILITIPGITIGIILLLLALMRAERRIHQRIEQLQEMQKLESLGRAAGRISHDFKNIISGIIGFTELAKLEDNCPKPLEELFDGIAQAAQRAVELSSSITGFTREDFGGFEPVDISSLLTEVNQLVKVSIPDRVELVVHLPNRQFTIEGNATQLYQVFMNLAINASHAIEERGQIILSASEEIEGVLTITVRDTGCGIESSQLPQIFNSGYTTNGKSGGSGFGLFIVKEIIGNHSGKISVESTPGKGTTFTIELPLI